MARRRNRHDPSQLAIVRPKEPDFELRPHPGMEGRMPTIRLEELVSDSPAGSVSAIVNNAPNFGFSEQSLDTFLTGNTRDNLDLKHIFYGLMDMEGKDDRMPVEFYLNTNTSEQAAYFLGNYLLKTLRQFPLGKSVVKYDKLKEEQKAEILIHTLVEIGYTFYRIRQMRGRGFSGHLTKPGSLLKRMAALPPDAKQRVIDLFGRERLNPNRSRQDPYDFIDPNQGKYKGIEVGRSYARLIEQKTAEVYQRNMQQTQPKQ